MDASMNPITTYKPQPITAIKPTQYLPPIEGLKYPSIAEINRSEQLKQINVHIPPKLLQPANDIGMSFHKILVRAMEPIALQDNIKINSTNKKEPVFNSFQNDSFLLARLLNR